MRTYYIHRERERTNQNFSHHTRQTPDKLLPKLFGELRERYADRPGGYTRVLRTEPLNRHNLDQAESAILEFVDGKVDTRFSMTAAAVARAELGGWRPHPTTLLNVKKVTAFRKDGAKEFRALVRAIKQTMPLPHRGAAADAGDDVVGASDDLDDYDRQPEAKPGRGARQRQRRAALRGGKRRAALREGEERAAGRRAPVREEGEDGEDEWEDLEEASEVEEQASGGRADRGRGGKRGRRPAGGKRYEKGRPRAPTQPASF